MDPGRYGTSDRLHHMGVHQLVRSVSDILCHGIEPSAVGHLLGWLCADLSSLLRRDVLGPGHRCRLFPPGHSLGFNVPAAGSFHDFPIHDVLAIVPGSRTVYWLGKWALVLPDPVIVVDILYEEAIVSHRYCRVRKRNGWPDISGYRAAITPQDRFPLDRESVRLRHACTPSYNSELDAYQITTKKDRASS